MLVLYVSSFEQQKLNFFELIGKKAEYGLN